MLHAPPSAAGLRPQRGQPSESGQLHAMQQMGFDALDEGMSSSDDGEGSASQGDGSQSSSGDGQIMESDGIEDLCR